MAYEHIAAVTGANKGIGLAIVRQLALNYPKSPLNGASASSPPQSFLIYLTSRDQGRGEQAVRELRDDPALKQARALAQDGGPTEIRWHALDVTQTNSIRTFTDFLREQHGAIDVAVNNAGVALDGFDGKVVKQTLEANYYGTLEATQDFLSVLKPDGRVVNVASTVGSLGSRYSDAVKQRFRAGATGEGGAHGQITALMRDFQKAVDADGVAKAGFPSSAYAASKAGCIGMTMAIAREEKAKGNKALINACCPGYVNTDMTKGKGFKTPDQGAKTPVMLALDDIGGVSGEMWSSERVIEW